MTSASKSQIVNLQIYSTPERCSCRVHCMDLYLFCCIHSTHKDPGNDCIILYTNYSCKKNNTTHQYTLRPLSTNSIPFALGNLAIFTRCICNVTNDAWPARLRGGHIVFFVTFPAVTSNLLPHFQVSSVRLLHATSGCKLLLILPTTSSSNTPNYIPPQPQVSLNFIQE